MSMPSIITLGSFDGVHRGHQAILGTMRRLGQQQNLRSVALVFGIPPRLTLHPRRTRPLLTTIPEKTALLKALGIAHLDVLRFDRRTASMTPEAFFDKIIRRKHDARVIVVGPRVAFGKDRAGTLEVLQHLGRSAGVRVVIAKPVGGGKALSSTQIRQWLAEGDIARANRALGYAYSVAGPVITGDGRGRKLGSPTLNIDVDPGKILPPGVFYVQVLGAKGQAWHGVCNVGTRPTFTPEAKDTRVEVHLLTSSVRWPKGQRARIFFVRRIRAEKPFASSDALIRQITTDIRRAKQFSRQIPLLRGNSFVIMPPQLWP